MTCSGCSNAVSRALNKLEGVENVDIDMDKQEVVVTTTLTRETVLEAIKKTGKEVNKE
ncbi:Cytosolic copper metallochaperone [Apophysomyces sp. BC1034]|nr:Cytosolic copper metallochaperone [Apophysomyces sp. BC1015]KAG0180878.1 Cytosolic copper metallochaperone [Apophysomyces sp. BC1021]KAG0191292.1 Cytosolic copper metallochaperone [Apophysomyces sp. BC1034]